MWGSHENGLVSSIHCAAACWHKMHFERYRRKQKKIPIAHKLIHIRNVYNQNWSLDRDHFEADCLVIYLEQVKFRRWSKKWKRKEDRRTTTTTKNSIFMITFCKVDAFFFLFSLYAFDLDGTIGKWTRSAERIVPRSIHGHWNESEKENSKFWVQKPSKGKFYALIEGVKLHFRLKKKEKKLDERKSDLICSL